MEKCFNYSPSFTPVIFTLQKIFHIIVSLSSFSYFLEIISVDSEARLVLLPSIFNVFFLLRRDFFLQDFSRACVIQGCFTFGLFLMNDLIFGKRRFVY